MLNEKDLQKALKNIISSLKLKIFHWRLEGSANLFVQGVPIAMNDIDICTTAEGMYLFKKALEKFPQVEGYNERTGARYVRINVHGIPVEICCYDNHGLRMLEHTVPKNWKEMNLPVLPVPKALEFYQQIKRLDKVNLIQGFLEEQKGKVRVIRE